MPNSVLSSAALAGLSDVDKKSAEIVARTAWGEARSLHEEGMHGVCNVIINRVNLKTWYGLNPVAVCLKSAQFDCWDKGDVNRAKLLAVGPDDPQFAIALLLAALAVRGNLPDITGGAVQYYDTSIPPPGWTKAMVFTRAVGNLRFYGRKP